MIRSDRLELPENCTGREEILRYLDHAAAELAESISRELGADFEGRALEAQHDFGGYTNWNIEVRRRDELEAIVSIEWSERRSPTHFGVSIADADEQDWVPPAAALGLFAGLGAVASATITPAAGLAFAVVGGAFGYIAALALKRLATELRPKTRSETISRLGALARETRVTALPA